MKVFARYIKNQLKSKYIRIKKDRMGNKFIIECQLLDIGSKMSNKQQKKVKKKI